MTAHKKALAGLAKSASIVFIGSVAGRILSLLGQILIVRSLTPTLFGHVALAYTVVSTVGMLALLGVHEGVTRLMSADESIEYRRSVLYSGYGYAIIGSLIVIIILYILRFRIGGFLNDRRLAVLLILFFPYLVAYPLARVSFGALRAHKRSLAAVFSRDLGPRLTAILIFLSFAFIDHAFFGAIAYWVSWPIFMMLIAGYYLNQELSLVRVLARRPNLVILRELWTFSWPLAVSSMFFLLLSNVDVLMIGYFMQPQSVGLYRAIQPLRQITTFVLGSFTFLFLPLATGYYNDNQLDLLDQFYTISTKWVVALTFPPVLIFTLFARDVVIAFFGVEYGPASPALAVLTAGLFIRAIVGLNGDLVRAINRTKIELYAGAAGVIVNIPLNIVLIPRYGIVGAAAGTVVGYMVYNAIEVFAIYKVVKIHPFSINNLKPILPTLFVAIGINRMTVSLDLSLLTLFIIGVLITIIHLFSMLLTRSLEQADLFLIERLEERMGVDLGWVKSILRGHY